MRSFMKLSVKSIVACLIFFLIGLLIGRVSYQLTIPKIEFSSGSIVREKSKSFQYISPLLAVGDLSGLKGLEPLESKLQTVINEHTAAGDVQSVSVYVRDLDSGEWLSIHPEEKYAPASMFKIVYLLAVLKLAEQNPQILNSTIIYKASDTPVGEPAEPGAPQLQSGQKYTISELLRRMIVYSDNNAANLLGQMLTLDQKKMVFTDLNLTPVDFADKGDTFTADDYALFLRVLYNATYVSRDLSNAALALLTEVDFRQGLVAGVPVTVPVAHKYGHRSIEGAKPEEQFHDCGIFYQAQKTYLVCAMTRGSAADALQKTVADISHTVYLYFAS